MLKYTKFVLLSLIAITCSNLTGCVRALLPTSENQLISKAINNGFEAELDVDYVEAYANLKQAYEKCIAYKSFTDQSYIAINANLDRDAKMGSITANANYGTYVSKVNLHEISPKKTKINLYLAQSKLLTNNFNLIQGHKRFEAEVNRALGADTKCNKN